MVMHFCICGVHLVPFIPYRNPSARMEGIIYHGPFTDLAANLLYGVFVNAKSAIT